MRFNSFIRRMGVWEGARSRRCSRCVIQLIDRNWHKATYTCNIYILYTLCTLYIHDNMNIISVHIEHAYICVYVNMMIHILHFVACQPARFASAWLPWPNCAFAWTNTTRSFDAHPHSHTHLLHITYMSNHNSTRQPYINIAIILDFAWACAFGKMCNWISITFTMYRLSISNLMLLKTMSIVY